MLNPSAKAKQKKIQQLRGKKAVLEKRASELDRAHTHADEQHYEWSEKAQSLANAMLGISFQTPAGSKVPQKKEAKILPRYRRALKESEKWEKQREFLTDRLAEIEEKIDEINDLIQFIETGEENPVKRKRPTKKRRDNPTPAQLRARAKFVKMVRARAKATKATKKNPRQTPYEKQRRAFKKRVSDYIVRLRDRGYLESDIVKGVWNVHGLVIKLHPDHFVIQDVIRGTSERVDLPRSNPGRQHLPGATTKQQRQYEDILSSARASGRYKGREKEVAARTVRARAINKAGRISQADLDKLPDKARRQIERQLGTLDQQERKAATPAQVRKVQQKRRSLLSRIGTRLRVLGSTKKFKVAARDLGKCKTKTLSVRSRHATDAIAKAKSQLGGSRYDQFRIKNAVSKLQAVKAESLKRDRAALNDLIRLINRIKARIRIAKSAAERSFLRAQMIQLRGEKIDVERRIQSAANPRRRNKTIIKARRVKIAVTNPKKGGQGRVTATSRRTREMFTGQRARGSSTMTAASGTPKSLAKLGRLVSIKTTRGKTFRPPRSKRNPQNQVWLTADDHHRLHLAADQMPVMTERGRDFGEIAEIEYETAKPHLGYRKSTLFFHHLGEEGGTKPHLVSDRQDGALKIIGGSYRITERGLED